MQDSDGTDKGIRDVAGCSREFACPKCKTGVVEVFVKRGFIPKTQPPGIIEAFLPDVEASRLCSSCGFDPKPHYVIYMKTGEKGEWLLIYEE